MSEQEQINEREETIKQVATWLLPLVSPYDLSDSQKLNQYHNNPYFHQAVKVNIFI